MSVREHPAAHDRTTDGERSGPDAAERLANPRTRLGTYALTMAIYAAGMGLTAWRLRRRSGGATMFDVRDLALAALATERAARLVTKEAVTSPIRAPFTRFRGVDGPATLDEVARDESKLRHTMGELLTCPYCLGQWIAGAFVAGLALTPTPTRFVVSTLAVSDIADWLQRAHARLS